MSGNQKGELLLYQTEDGRAAIQLRAVDGTVWLTQAEMAVLFDSTVQNVNLHLKNIFEDNELHADSVIKESLITAADGKAYNTRLYNLDAILAVGYRVRGPRGSQFRRWATTVLREYLVKGFALNDEALKEPGGFDYFDELLARIREIRASEKRFYQKIRDLFKATSVDYNAADEAAKEFFATIQNKLIFAVTGKTAAELVARRADAAKANMGLNSWAGSRVRKTDVVVAKNYLAEKEMAELNRLTTMFLDFAEDRAERRQQIAMAEWIAQTDRFLSFNERGVLQGKGRVSHTQAEQIAHERFEVFDAARRVEEALAAEREAEADLAQLEHAAETLKKKLPKPKRGA
ncbi:virulence RhuM family protein [Acidocella sp. KAb 2-4]|uniref:virulence RhuM family protein n=1 Tax=Acidocella sp. KAb 2-4 TaxID=2885158 RepID=UPI001D07D4F9|nr:virulence RhuM family protein [Acidocella sp. KAb 2-4]MCB5945988.1 virulence RhuM family protein [Acidocella sp. KAb 2-4]